MAATLETAEPVAVILIGGGARSGKSRYALEKARAIDGTRAFVATAQPFDKEMTTRIDRHRAERGAEFITIEEPLDLAAAVAHPHDVILVDCLTLWLSNLMFADKNVDLETRTLLAASQASAGTLIFVTNEVGAGIVPDNAIAREFRDRAGILNQRIAAIAHEVYWMVFGQPLRVK
ncbi:MAG: bifunctional adenosylcobinamide kinase/adenosylcobinamide-phosphate guanylyltransferase [Bryobacteraceae bacterium]|jgi:adenosylcobinamide kinase/adenosylcobinamide-phosphate guanylyltransferase